MLTIDAEHPAETGHGDVLVTFPELRLVPAEGKSFWFGKPEGNGPHIVAVLAAEGPLAMRELERRSKNGRARQIVTEVNQYVRPRLGRDLIVNNDGKYGLTVDVDWHTFDTLADQIASLWTAGDEAGALAATENAIAHYSGRPFGCLAERNGVVDRAEKLRARWDTVLDLYAHTCERTEQWQRLTESLAPVVDDNVRPELTAVLVPALLALGEDERADAATRRFSAAADTWDSEVAAELEQMLTRSNLPDAGPASLYRNDPNLNPDVD